MLATDGTGNDDIVGDVAVPSGQLKLGQPHGAESKAGLGRSASMAAGLCFRCLWAGVLTDAESSEGCRARKDKENMWQMPLAGLGQGT